MTGAGLLVTPVLTAMSGVNIWCSAQEDVTLTWPAMEESFPLLLIHNGSDLIKILFLRLWVCEHQRVLGPCFEIDKHETVLYIWTNESLLSDHGRS